MMYVSYAFSVLTLAHLLCLPTVSTQEGPANKLKLLSKTERYICEQDYLLENESFSLTYEVLGLELDFIRKNRLRVEFSWQPKKANKRSCTVELPTCTANDAVCRCPYLTEAQLTLVAAPEISSTTIAVQLLQPDAKDRRRTVVLSQGQQKFPPVKEECDPSQPAFVLTEKSKHYWCGMDYMLDGKDEFRLTYSISNWSPDVVQMIEDKGYTVLFKWTTFESNNQKEAQTCSVNVKTCEKQNWSICWCENGRNVKIVLTASVLFGNHTIGLYQGNKKIADQKIPAVLSECEQEPQLRLVTKNQKFFCGYDYMLAGRDEYVAMFEPEPYSLDHLRAKNVEINFLWGSKSPPNVIGTCSVNFTTCGTTKFPAGLCSCKGNHVTFSLNMTKAMSRAKLIVNCLRGDLVLQRQLTLPPVVEDRCQGPILSNTRQAAGLSVFAPSRLLIFATFVGGVTGARTLGAR